MVRIKLSYFLLNLKKSVRLSGGRVVLDPGLQSEGKKLLYLVREIRDGLVSVIGMTSAEGGNRSLFHGHLWVIRHIEHVPGTGIVLRIY